MQAPSHNNLSPEVNQNIRMSEVLGGVWALEHPDFVNPEIKAQPVLPVGRSLLVETRNTHYVIRKVSENGERCNFTIQGHPEYCPEPKPCHIQGSTWGGSMLKMGWIGVGMHLKVWIEGVGTITTSQIQSVAQVS